MGSNLGDEIDCNSFFDQMDDLIESGEFDSTDCKDYPSIWNDPLFSAVNSASDDFSADLSLPCEDIVQLEWLSTFVEDSYSYGGLTMGKENSCVNNMESSHSKFLASSPVSVLESSSSSSNSNSSSMIPTPSPCHRGPQRARSKRPRPSTFNPRPVTHLMSPTSSCTKLIVCAASESDTAVESPMKNIPKKKKLKSSIRSDQNQLTTLVKCMHCEITETPQWRAGPMGPRTLCNACGVRYKKGQLFPEYRPVASPTFVPSLHSNSHKKVLEMRINN